MTTPDLSAESAEALVERVREALPLFVGERFPKHPVFVSERFPKHPARAALTELQRRLERAELRDKMRDDGEHHLLDEVEARDAELARLRERAGAAEARVEELWEALNIALDVAILLVEFYDSAPIEPTAEEVGQPREERSD